jgi:hypothetical protein
MEDVVNPAIGGGTCDDRCDVIELHNYTGGRRPTEGGLPLGEGEGGDPNAEVSLTQTLADHQALAPTKPIVCGEVGQDAQSVLNPAHPPALERPGVTTALAQAKYMSRTPLIYYKAGVLQTCFYAWLNNWTNDFHGMRDNNKPTSQSSVYPEFTGTAVAGSFTFDENLFGEVLRRSLAVTSDPGADFVVTPFAYEFTGPDADGELIHHLFQKRNGKYYIRVHKNGVSYKRSVTQGDTSPAPAAECTLTLGVSVADVKWHKPLLSATPTELGAGQVFEFLTGELGPILDSEQILEITP